jgi:ectoine hydroxylase-related dioxygenase (phytanoyl-CoA dioxygenase family)
MNGYHPSTNFIGATGNYPIYDYIDNSSNKITNYIKYSSNEVSKYMYSIKQVSKYIKEVLGYDGEVLNMQYFIKHPNYKITAPHQDGAYFDNLDDDILTFWIPLHDVDETTSTMFYVDWDGKREIIKHDDCGTNKRTRTGKTGMSQYTSEYPLEDFTPVILKYGDCVIHNQFSVHYSNENSTTKPRIAITCIIKLNK